MSNQLPALPDQAPQYLMNMASEFSEFLDVSNDALGGLSTGAPPTIATKGTRFVIKEGGEELVLDTMTLKVVVLKARPGVSKAFYINKYVPGQEPQAPDCSSIDGLKPDAGVPLPQHTNCAGCPNNAFGTGTDASGNASKGKACADNKVLAVLYQGGTYLLKVPPASLKNFAAYIKLLSSRNLYVPAVVTQISFDPNFSYAVLTFNYAGTLDEKGCYAVRERINSQEVQDIIGGIAPAAQKQLPPSAQKEAVAETTVALDLGGVAGEPQAPPQTQAQAQANKPKPQPAKPKPQAQPEPVQQEAAPSASTLADELGLNL